CGPAAQPRQQREPTAVRTESSDRQGDDQRRHQTDTGVYAVSAFGQGHESGVKQAISSADAPKAIGPYSPAVRTGQLLFVSGQVPIDPATGSMVAGDIAAQTRRVLDNVSALLKAASRSFADVVRTTVFLADMN